MRIFSESSHQQIDFKSVANTWRNIVVQTYKRGKDAFKTLKFWVLFKWKCARTVATVHNDLARIGCSRIRASQYKSYRNKQQDATV